MCMSTAHAPEWSAETQEPLTAGPARCKSFDWDHAVPVAGGVALERCPFVEAVRSRSRRSSKLLSSADVSRRALRAQIHDHDTKERRLVERSTIYKPRSRALFDRRALERCFGTLRASVRNSFALVAHKGRAFFLIQTAGCRPLSTSTHLTPTTTTPITTSSTHTAHRILHPPRFSNITMSLSP